MLLLALYFCRWKFKWAVDKMKATTHHLCLSWPHLNRPTINDIMLQTCHQYSNMFVRHTRNWSCSCPAAGTMVFFSAAIRDSLCSLCMWARHLEKGPMGCLCLHTHLSVTVTEWPWNSPLLKAHPRALTSLLAYLLVNWLQWHENPTHFTTLAAN